MYARAHARTHARMHARTHTHTHTHTSKVRHFITQVNHKITANTRNILSHVIKYIQFRGTVHQSIYAAVEITTTHIQYTHTNIEAYNI